MSSKGELKREVGVFGATMMGMGAMVGTGVFVSIGIAAGVAGPSVVLAIALAAIVATCNALSSAQLAASTPVSGGTYEYGYAYLNPWLGFTAGWMFLCAKVASAATAALGFAGYLLQALAIEDFVVPVAVAATTALTLIVLAGIRRSSWTNVLIVSITMFALSFFVIAGSLTAWSAGSEPWQPFFQSGEGRGPVAALLQATALMFVAFTGYARIATLGEEVKEPRSTIPRAIVYTLILSGLLYVAVGAVGISTIGPTGLAGAAQSEVAPLEVAARTFDIPGATWIISIGAMTAMLGVLLKSSSRAVPHAAGNGPPPRYAGRVCLGEQLRFASRRRDRCRRCHRRARHAWEREGDLVFQRVHRAYLLCDHQSRGATPAKRRATLFAAYRLGRPCRVPIPRLLGRTANLAHRSRANRGGATLAHRGQALVSFSTTRPGAMMNDCSKMNDCFVAQ